MSLDVSKSIHSLFQEISSWLKKQIRFCKKAYSICTVQEQWVCRGTGSWSIFVLPISNSRFIAIPLINPTAKNYAKGNKSQDTI